MVIQTTKVKNGTIVLPPKFKKSWKEANVWLQISKKNIFIRKLDPPSVSDMLKEFRKIGKNISKKDVMEN